MYFLIKCMVGAPAFIGWFILIYLGEMLVTWLTIVPSHPEWAVPAVYILEIAAASFAFRKAMKAVERWERGTLRY